MKNVLIGIIITLGILILSLNTIVNNKFDLYKEAEHVTYDQVLAEDNTTTIYYYYKDSCHFCASIKNQVTNVYNATTNRNDINLKLVDMALAKNNGAWANDEYDIENIEGVEKGEDIKIKGTPAMIIVENGQLTDYKVGPDVFDIMEDVNDEFNLELSFDRSAYGKEV